MTSPTVSSSSQSFHLSPTFDLDSYISRYEANSETRLQRLVFIARQVSKYAADSNVARDLVLTAYSQVEQHLKDNYDTRRYQLLFAPNSTAMDSVATNAPMLSQNFVYDSAFVTQTDLASHAQLQTLEACLTTAQAHLAKDSIRLAHLTLVDFYKVRGDLTTALKYALRSRDYCTLPKASIQVHLLIIELLLQMGTHQVLEFVVKAELLKDNATGNSTSSGTEIHSDGLVVVMDESALLSSKLNAASALAHLEQGRYSEALSKFLKLDPGFTHQYHSILSAEDIAVYGGILALATLSRKDIYSNMLDSNASFKERLELVPVLRDAIQHYTRSEYRSCLLLLYSLRPELDLDLRFHSHLDTLLEKIRDKCLIQFFTPYSVVSLQSLADCIGVDSTEDMETIIANLILSGKWNGVRIHSYTQTLHAISPVELERRRKRGTYQKVLQLGDTFMAETQNTLLRLSCIENGLVVKDESGGGGNKKSSYFMGKHGSFPHSQEEEDLITSYMGYGGGGSRYEPSHHVVDDDADEYEQEEDVVMMDREDTRRYYK